MKRLLITLTDRDDHPTAFFQLLDEQLRNVFGRTRHNDLVKGSVFRPAFETIAIQTMHVRVAQILHPLLSLF